MTISVIIPTWNEESKIGSLVKFILRQGGNSIAQVLVADGNSDDNTVTVAASAGAVTLTNLKKSRAVQMNAGAERATGDILYFIHADVKLVPSFAEDILKSVREGYHSGCYRYVFDSPHPMLKINGYCTRFSGIMCRGGDQTLFVTKTTFKDLQGFNPSFSIMEDYDFIIRLRKKYRFKIIAKNLIVSARKYEKNSWLRVQLANLSVFLMFFLRQSPDRMKVFYNKVLRYR